MLTLCISVLALIVAAGSLTWQVVSWRRSGPQISVGSTWESWLVICPCGSWPWKRETLDGWRRRLNSLAGSYPTDGLFRMSTTFSVSLFGCRCSSDRAGKVTMHYEAADIRRLLREEGVSRENVRPYVVTGTGVTRGSQSTWASELRTSNDVAPTTRCTLNSRRTSYQSLVAKVTG